MAAMYGHRWTSSFGDRVDPDRVWAATLAGLDEVQVRHGMRQCAELGLEWPPSAPEFRKLCLGQSDVSWEHNRIVAADRERAARSLEHRPTTASREAVGRDNLNAMLGMLGMSGGRES